MKTSKQEGKLAAKQMANYNSFLETFQSNTKIHYELMTSTTKEKVIKKIEDRAAKGQKTINYYT